MTAPDSWIGFERSVTDVATERLVQEFRKTLDGTIPHVAGLPGIQWCLCPDIHPPADLGRDGHPRTGLFLPDMGLPRRMWAGGKLAYSAGGIASGETVRRVSTIRDVRFKSGRSGRLGFVTIDHIYSVGGSVRVTEEQNIVYRDNPEANAVQIAAPEAAPWEVVASFGITPGPTLLFRYSAMTFNGHRIHYDHTYATGVEGYDGLVVHGPMQATWMQHMAADLLGRLPAQFTYRGLSPLICGRAASIEARDTGNGGLELRVRDITANTVTMEASAE